MPAAKASEIIANSSSIVSGGFKKIPLCKLKIIERNYSPHELRKGEHLLNDYYGEFEIVYHFEKAWESCRRVIKSQK